MSRFALAVLVAAPLILVAAPANGDQFTLVDREYTHPDNAKEASHSFNKPSATQPSSWVAPANYAEGTMYIAHEVKDKPLIPTRLQICIRNASSYCCSAQYGFTSPGTYRWSTPVPKFWNYNTMRWTTALTNVSIIIKDKNGNKLDSPNAQLYAIRHRITISMVSKGSPAPAGWDTGATDAGGSSDAQEGSPADAGPPLDTGEKNESDGELTIDAARVATGNVPVSDGTLEDAGTRADLRPATQSRPPSQEEDDVPAGRTRERPLGCTFAAGTREGPPSLVWLAVLLTLGRHWRCRSARASGSTTTAASAMTRQRRHPGFGVGQISMSRGARRAARRGERQPDGDDSDTPLEGRRS